MLYEVYDIDSLGCIVEVLDIRTYASKTSCEIYTCVYKEVRFSHDESSTVHQSEMNI